MSEVTAPPSVLDTSVVTAVARGDPDIIGLIQGYDARGQLLVVPAPAIAGASLQVRREEADDLLGGLELLDNLTYSSRMVVDLGRWQIRGLRRSDGSMPDALAAALAAVPHVTRHAEWARLGC